MNDNFADRDKLDKFDAVTINLTDSKQLIISKKRYLGDFWIDCRHWVRFRGKTEFFPTRKGVFISQETFKREVLPVLIRMCEESW